MNFKRAKERTLLSCEQLGASLEGEPSLSPDERKVVCQAANFSEAVQQDGAGKQVIQSNKYIKVKKIPHRIINFARKHQPEKQVLAELHRQQATGQPAGDGVTHAFGAELGTGAKMNPGLVPFQLQTLMQTLPEHKPSPASQGLRAEAKKRQRSAGQKP